MNALPSSSLNPTRPQCSSLDLFCLACRPRTARCVRRRSSLSLPVRRPPAWESHKKREKKSSPHTHRHKRTHRQTLGHKCMASEVAAGAAGGPRLLPTSSRQRFAGSSNSSRQWPISPGPRLRQGLEIASGFVGESVDMLGIFAAKKQWV